MKRDMDLIRNLLMRIEEFPPEINNKYDYTIAFNGFNSQEINFHLNLLKDAGFIGGIIQKSIINKHRSINNETLELTWKGFEFLDSARDNTVWKKAKKTVSNKIQTVSFEVFMAVLVQMTKEIIFNKS